MDHMHTFSVKAMVRGYHVYKSVWDAACDDNILPCKREIGNPHDPSSVAVKKGIVVDGHVPRKISTIYSVIICWGCTILCRVNGSWCYSSNLLQGVLEIPCILIFSTPQVCESKKLRSYLNLLWLSLLNLLQIPKIIKLQFLQGYLIPPMPTVVPT